MKIFFSGGSEIAETGIKNPAVMLSFFVVVPNRKTLRPNSRARRVLKNRVLSKKAKRRKK